MSTHGLEENLFSTAFSLNPVPATICSVPDARIVHVNEAFLQLSGLHRDTIAGTSLASLPLWVSSSPINRIISTLTGSDTTQKAHVQMHTASGEIIDCLLIAKTITLESVSYIFSSYIDITEHKKANTQLEKTCGELQLLVQQHTLDLATSNSNLCKEIDERIRIEQELQEKEATTRALLNTPTDTLIMIDAGGIIHEINEVAAKRYNKPIDELIGVCVWDMIPQEAAEPRKQYVNDVVRTGRAIRFEDDRDGVWYDNVFYPIFGPSREIKYIAILARDISERISAEKIIRESREWVDLTLRGADLGLWDWDVQSDIYTTSHRYAEMLGYVDHEIPEKIDAWKKLLHPDDVKTFTQVLAEHMAGTRPQFEMEFRLRSKSGQWKNIFSRGKVMRWDISGNPLRMAGTVLDITEIKHTEEELRRTTEQLSVLLESLPIVPYTRRGDGDWGIIYVGKNVQEITGYTADQFSQNPTFWRDHIHPDEKERIFRELSIIREQETQWFEYRFRVADGSYKWLRNLRRIFKNPDSTISHVVGTWQDIDYEVKLRQESEYRLQQIIQADKLASLGEVVAGVAHEINNPNSFITYNIPLLDDTWNIFRVLVDKYLQGHPHWQHDGLSADELIQDMDDIIEAIRTGSDRINKVVTNLKDFARMDDTDMTRPVQVNEVIEKALTIVGAQIRKSAERIEIDLAPDLPCIQGQFQKLEQVITNLIVNALHAIPSRHNGALIIRSRFVEIIAAVIIEVEDNGSGIPPDLLDRIFDPFFTTRRSKGGTGLGLSVSYTLIKEHAGIIGVLSRPGIGSRFSIIIPLNADNPLYLRTSILCIEDHKSFQKELLAYLPNATIITSEQAACPDLVLLYLEEHPETDIMICNIPSKDHATMTLIEHITARFPLLAYILYSDDTQAIQQTMNPMPGCCHFIQKPFSILDLQTIISSIDRQKL